jgi:hypothetical protein
LRHSRQGIVRDGRVRPDGADESSRPTRHPCRSIR